MSSFIELVPFLFTLPGVTGFLSNKINQDPLEKFFGIQRQAGRSNDNPTVSQFIKNTDTIRIINSIWIAPISPRVLTVAPRVAMIGSSKFAVAVLEMKVDIKNSHSINAVLASMFRGNRRIVQKTIPTELIKCRMMARRPGEREGGLSSA